MKSMKQIDKKILDITLSQYLDSTFRHEIFDIRFRVYFEALLNEIILLLEDKMLDDNNYWEEICSEMRNGPKIGQNLFDDELNAIIKQKLSEYPRIVQYTIWLKSDFDLDAIPNEHSPLILNYNSEEATRYICNRLYQRADEWNCIQQNFSPSRLFLPEFNLLH